MKLSKLFEQLQIFPNNSNVYWEAFTHPSFVDPSNGKNYQRLEFLGDAIIGAAVSVYLFNKNSGYSEGDMTVLKANFVNQAALAKYSKNLKLENFLRLGKGAENLGKNKKVQADIFESLVGAIFVDQGIEKTKLFLEKTILKDIAKSNNAPSKNPKTILQEFLQSENRTSIQYKAGKKNDKFVSKIIFERKVLGQGEGKTKKEAEIEAAKSSLKKLNKG